MSNADRDRLVTYMSNALDRVTDALDADEELPVTTGRAGRDEWDELSESTRDLLTDLGVEPDEDGEWDPEQGRERVHEDLDDVLCVTFDRGEPFDVTLTLGGPNIHLVDFGAHGGSKIIGYWGERVEWSSPQVRRAVDYYWEAFADLAASDD